MSALTTFVEWVMTFSSLPLTCAKKDCTSTRKSDNRIYCGNHVFSCRRMPCVAHIQVVFEAESVSQNLGRSMSWTEYLPLGMDSSTVDLRFQKLVKEMFLLKNKTAIFEEIFDRRQHLVELTRCEHATKQLLVRILNFYWMGSQAHAIYKSQTSCPSIMELKWKSYTYNYVSIECIIVQ